MRRRLLLEKNGPEYVFEKGGGYTVASCSGGTLYSYIISTVDGAYVPFFVKSYDGYVTSVSEPLQDFDDDYYVEIECKRNDTSSDVYGTVTLVQSGSGKELTFNIRVLEPKYHFGMLNAANYCGGDVCSATTTYSRAGGAGTEYMDSRYCDRNVPFSVVSYDGTVVTGATSDTTSVTFYVTQNPSSSSRNGEVVLQQSESSKKFIIKVMQYGS